jgi:uncharacterized protein (TIGR00255 family)
MIRSMTGFGRGEASGAACRVQVDVRSVNHRHLDLQLRLPRNLQPLEMEAREWLKERFWRGRVEAYVLFERQRRDVSQIHIDEELAAGYQQRLTALADRLGMAERPSLALVVEQPGVRELADEPDDFESVRPALREAVARATDAALAMKQREGEALRRDLLAKLARLRELRERLAAEAPRLAQELVARLRERAAQMAADFKLDEGRLHQETALWLTRLDVNEELVRLQSHFAQFAALLDRDESVGRRLDFLAQEMHREITTLGNKLQGNSFGEAALDAKVEIEKIREQVQNVE